MDELTLNNEKYISSKRAAKITGYTKDYVGQLCREGKIIAQLVGRNWYISESSIRNHRFELEDSSLAHTSTISKHIAKSKDTQHHTLHDTVRYVHNDVDIIPLLKKKETIAEVRKINTPQDFHKKEYSQKEKSDILSTMQSAWQEWFTTTTHEIKEDLSILDKDNSKNEELSKVKNSSEYIPEEKLKIDTDTHSSLEHDVRPVSVHKVLSPLDTNEYIYRDTHTDTVRRRRSYYKRSHIANVINVTLMLLALTFFIITLLNIFLSTHADIYQLHYITGTSVYTAK